MPEETKPKPVAEPSETKPETFGTKPSDKLPEPK
jgi:hypothetical protein